LHKSKNCACALKAIRLSRP